MPVFEYKATDANGNPLSGTLLSSSLAAAADELSKKGLNVSHVALASTPQDPVPQTFASPQARGEQASALNADRRQPAPTMPRTPPPTTPRPAVVTQVIAPLVYRVPLSQLLFLFRQLATMLNAGVPLAESLDTLSRQTRDPKLKPVVTELLGHVREGRELSVGMARYPDVFSPLMLGMVRAGEQSGLLDQSLNHMADYVQQEIELRNVLRRATLYPKLVLFSSIVIILVANYFLRAVFDKPDQLQSPLTDGATWVVLVPIIAFLFLFFRVGVQNPNVKQGYDKFLLMIPGIGSTVHQMAMAKFSSAFAALYKGGVPMPRAVEYAADACGSSYLRSRIYPASKELQEGEGITSALIGTGAFLPQVIDMTRTGETTGKLDDMLERVAKFYEDDSKVKADQQAKIFGVVCLLAVGLYVGYIAYHFYSGISGRYSGAGAGD